MVGHLVCKTKDKNKIKTYEQRYRIPLYRQRQKLYPFGMGKLVWVSIHCDSKMDMTDLKAGESWRQNSNSTICYTQDQKKKKKPKQKPEYESRKMV